MAKSSELRFNCPSCASKLEGIEKMDTATQVVTRTCRRCGDRWQLVVKAVRVGSMVRIDYATITFRDNVRARTKQIEGVLAAQKEVRR